MCGIFLVSSDQPEEAIKLSFQKITHRGPDFSILEQIDKDLWLGFHRLSIMDLSSRGNQPFKRNDLSLICNGEIYNYKEIKSDFFDSYAFRSTSDCEIILPLISQYGLDKACNYLDGEFSFVGYDQKEKKIFAARDPMGIRPLFYGYSTKNSICFASEAKALTDICKEIFPFPPGHYYQDGKFTCYLNYRDIIPKESFDLEKEVETIRKNLTSAVIKRLHSDAPIGFLLSGGLDSSLVCSIATKHLKQPIKTFSIGIEDSAIDTKYARIVAEYLGADHHEVLFKKEDIFKTLPELIYHLETFDITTIRAAMGMYLVSKYIKEHSDCKVILTGEVSDEIFGYKYTDFAPTPFAFQEESYKRVEEIYMYDVLRADRSISAHSLEARVPFSDRDFVKHVLSIKSKHKMNDTGVGKYLLRKAFQGKNYLPDSILFREKAAFSDAVGHTCVDYLKEYAEKKYSELELKRSQQIFSHCPPKTKEALLYRKIFESYFKGHSKLIKDFWMPNPNWENCDVDDPSARALPNYGKSGT
jgi:asparagine synthase (glutamine-hydrolysing)